MSKLTILKVESNHEDLHKLIQRLDEDLLERYPADEIYLVDFSNPKVKKWFSLLCMWTKNRWLVEGLGL